MIDYSNGYYYLVEKCLGVTAKVYLGKDNVVFPDHLIQICEKLFQKIIMSGTYLQYQSMLTTPYHSKLENIIKYNLQDGMKSLKNEDIQQFIHDFVYHSNKAEGSKIAYEDFMKVIHHKKPNTKNRNEIQEVKNSTLAWNYLMNDFIRNEISIKRLYKILTNTLLTENGTPYPQGYKKDNNMIGNMYTVDSSMVASEMKQLLQRYKVSKKTLFPLQLAFEFHYRFEKIHPFADANGRVGRLLMNKILYDNGLIPTTIFSENRTAYFNAFQKAREKGSFILHEFLIDQYKKTLAL